MDNASDLRVFPQQRRNECFKHIGKVMYESCNGGLLMVLVLLLKKI